MRVGELRRQTGATVRALRYYERLGLIVPDRSANGYRSYDPVAVDQVRQVQHLTRLGFRVAQTKPFLDCLGSGHVTADDCPASLAAYRSAIAQLTDRIDELDAWRGALASRLDAAAERVMGTSGRASSRGTAPSARVVPAPREKVEPTRASTPAIVGSPVPDVTLAASDGRTVHLPTASLDRVVLYVYPLTGKPGVDLPEGWETIPGARGCTAEACGFRDHHEDVREAGAQVVYGLSSQPTDYQAELVERLGLPFTMLSDPELVLARELGLATFDAGPMRLYRRTTLVLGAGRVQHVWTDVPDPARHALDVLAWLRAHPRSPDDGHTDAAAR
ncbi:redoxin domain-containing protein [Mumia sp. DW29H23]|uniref:redoxin domain-containing protein n=1 Tax=Mumia sp. DW29H23 TaxID=3421241 RepID=UPI003D694192